MHDLDYALVALFDPEEPAFKDCSLSLKGISEALCTAEAVLTDRGAALARSRQPGIEGVKRFVPEPYVALLPLSWNDSGIRVVQAAPER